MSAMVKGHCMLGLDEVTTNLTNYLNQIDQQLGSIREGKGLGEWELSGWLGWLRNVGLYAILLVLCISIGIGIVKCLITRVMTTLESIGSRPTQLMMVATSEKEKDEEYKHILDDEVQEETRQEVEAELYAEDERDKAILDLMRIQL